MGRRLKEIIRLEKIKVNIKTKKEIVKVEEEIREKTEKTGKTAIFE